MDVVGVGEGGLVRVAWMVVEAARMEAGWKGRRWWRVGEGMMC